MKRWKVKARAALPYAILHRLVDQLRLLLEKQLQVTLKGTRDCLLQTLNARHRFSHNGSKPDLCLRKPFPFAGEDTAQNVNTIARRANRCSLGWYSTENRDDPSIEADTLSLKGIELCVSLCKASLCLCN